MDHGSAGGVTATLLTVQLLNVERCICGAQRGISGEQWLNCLIGKLIVIVDWLKGFAVI